LPPALGLEFRSTTSLTYDAAGDKSLHRGLPNGKRQLKEGHKFQCDKHLPFWHGWHEAGRGLVPTAFAGVTDNVIPTILRQLDVNVTVGNRVKPKNLMG